MIEYERRNPDLDNFYDTLGIPYLASDRKVKVILTKLKQEAINSKDEAYYRYVQFAEEYLLERRVEYDKYLKRHGVKFPKTKKEKKMILIKSGIGAGLIVAIGLGAIAVFNQKAEENINSNVCVEYEIQKGDTLNELRDEYGLRDIGTSYLEISGYERQASADALGQDICNYVAVGDVVIGRTTKENADKLVQKGARIISIEEARDLLGENNLVGKFKEENGDFVFFIPNEKSLG